MLKKLMKYDFKATNKYLIPFSIFILLYAIIATPFFNFVELSDTGLGGKVAIVLLTVFFSIFLVLYVSSIMLINIVHFYKSMATDEGYLTHTLPVKKITVITSKLICAFLSVIAAIIIAMLGACIFFDIPSFISSFHTEFKDIWSVLYPSIHALDTLLFIVLCIVSICQGITMFYVSIALGQLINRHKVLGSILFYFVLSIIYQIIGMIAGLIYSADVAAHATTSSAGLTINFPYNSTLMMFLSLIASLALTVIQFVLTNYIFSKKLNLE